MRKRERDIDRQLTTVFIIFQNVKNKSGYLSLQHVTVFSMVQGSDNTVMSYLFTYLFMHDLFNNTVNSSDHIALNAMTGE
jgi:hypothetical protein